MPISQHRFEELAGKPSGGFSHWLEVPHPVAKDPLVPNNTVLRLIFNAGRESAIGSYAFALVMEGKSRPLSFLAQINCRELKAFDSEKLLPDSGLLYFFYDPEQSATGVDSKDRKKFKVLYYDGPFKNLKPVFFPEELPDSGQFDECSVHFMSSLSLPDVPGNWGIHMPATDLKNRNFKNSWVLLQTPETEGQ